MENFEQNIVPGFLNKNTFQSPGKYVELNTLMYEEQRYKNMLK